MLPISSIYGAALALLMVLLSSAVAVQRGKTGTVLGDGGHPALALAVRRFGNLTEYAPMAVLLLVLMELQGQPEAWLHGYGATLLALRLLHPVVLFDQFDAPGWQKAGRFVAAAGTVTLMLIAAIRLLIS